MASENIKLKQKADALELAYLLYDIFKESQSDTKNTENGQNNADQIKDD